MKKVILLFGMMLIASSVFVACTAEPLEDDKITATDKDKVCPPNDRNCNGIPDDQEDDN